MQQGINVEKVIRSYLPNIIHMSLATCSANKPWACEVHFVHDEELNLYFRSKRSRRHSQEIAVNPHVAGTIVTQHAQGEKPRGISFEGDAELLSSIDETSGVYRLFCKRFGLGPEILEEIHKPDGHHFYKVAVSDFYVFDVRESTPGQKYHLSWRP